jgi:hypothetical protein
VTGGPPAGADHGASSRSAAPPAVVAALPVRAAAHRAFALLLAFAVLVGHLVVLAPALDDIDAVNFALGVRSFDVAAHQPHPPGYPVYIALGKLSQPLGVLLGADRAVREARGLALLSAVFGALLVFPLFRLFSAVDRPGWRAGAATLVTVTAPLAWFTASRPMSDMPGLALAVLSQALSVRVLLAGAPPSRAAASVFRPLSRDRALLAAALVAGVAVGVRSQTAWLTGPLLIAALAQQAVRGNVGAAFRAALALVAGVLVWLVPMVSVSGGTTAYLAALGSQAGEDLAGVTMLALNPTPRALAGALLDTAIVPWVSRPLGAAVLLLSVLGVGVLAFRDRRALLLVLLAWAPYAAFHLLFQETATSRYALPLVPAMAYLAVCGASLAGRKAGIAASAALAVFGLAVTAPALARYARDGGPVPRAAAEIQAAGASEPHQVAMHLAFARALRGEPIARTALPSPDKREWLELVRYWRDGGAKPVWFLADPRRTDLALVDPASRRLRASYRWPPDVRPHLSGARPASVDWWEVGPPGWMLGEGWALTAEVAGVATVDRRGPALGGGATAYLRRRPGHAFLTIGGRNLGGADGPLVRFSVLIDGGLFEALEVPPRPGFFLRQWPLPAGALAGPGEFATLVVRAAAADGSGTPVGASVEQFDLQPATGLVAGYDEGWFEPEYDPATGRAWRWASGRAVLRVLRAAGRDLRVAIEAEDPARYGGGAAVEVTLEAGGQPVLRATPQGDFTLAGVVPGALVDASGGRLTLTTSRTFVPAERGEGTDARQLAMRVYRVTIEQN